MTRSTTPNLTRTTLRHLADSARIAADLTANPEDHAYATAVEDTIRCLLGDAGATPELTRATLGGLL